MLTARGLFGRHLNGYLIAMWLTNLTKIKKRSHALTHWAVLVEKGYNVLEWRYVNIEVAVLGLWWARLDSNINSLPNKLPSWSVEPTHRRPWELLRRRGAFLADACGFPAVGKAGTAWWEVMCSHGAANRCDPQRWDGPRSHRGLTHQRAVKQH